MLLRGGPVRTPALPVLGKCGDENGMHGIPPLGAIRSPRSAGTVYVECVRMLGPCYYARGPQADVLDVPTKLQSSWQ